MKIINKTNDEKVKRVIEENFSLYKRNPQFGFLPVIDEPDTFHLIKGKKEDEEKWYALFIESIVDYANKNKLNIDGKLYKNKIVFDNVAPDFLPIKE